MFDLRLFLWVALLFITVHTSGQGRRSYGLDLSLNHHSLTVPGFEKGSGIRVDNQRNISFSFGSK